VAVGIGGAILTSADGVTWQIRTSGTNIDLLGVSCPSVNACVALGGGGIILTSADGGITWQSRSSGTSQDQRGVSCPNMSACVVVGDFVQ
jgi:hypothetical protein